MLQDPLNVIGEAVGEGGAAGGVPGFKGPAVEAAEGKYARAERIWVMDRGMVSDQALASLCHGGRRYVLGTPRTRGASQPKTPSAAFISGPQLPAFGSEHQNQPC